MVYAQGEQVIDPYSSEVLGSEETTVGEIEVYETQARFSKCRIIKPFQRPEVIQKGQVCRPLEVVDSSGPVGTGGSPGAPGSKPKFSF